MNKMPRRNLLKGLGLSIPAAWVTPVLEVVVLPAHATATGGCSSSAGCYETSSDIQSVDWHGTGLAGTATAYSESGCGGDSFEVSKAAIGETEEDAIAAWGSDPGFNLQVPITGSSCSFWFVD